VQRREARLVGPVAHFAVDFGSEHNLLAPSAALGEPATDDLLGNPFAHFPAIDVRSVEEIDPQLQRPIHDGETIGFARQGTEVHRAEAEPAHAQAGASKSCVLHSVLPCDAATAPRHNHF
jgi:hypothetical protein